MSTTSKVIIWSVLSTTLMAGGLSELPSFLGIACFAGGLVASALGFWFSFRANRWNVILYGMGLLPLSFPVWRGSLGDAVVLSCIISAAGCWLGWNMRDAGEKRSEGLGAWLALMIGILLLPPSISLFFKWFIW